MLEPNREHDRGRRNAVLPPIGRQAPIEVVADVRPWVLRVSREDDALAPKGRRVVRTDPALMKQRIVHFLQGAGSFDAVLQGERRAYHHRQAAFVDHPMGLLPFGDPTYHRDHMLGAAVEAELILVEDLPHPRTRHWRLGAVDFLDDTLHVLASRFSLALPQKIHRIVADRDRSRHAELVAGLQEAEMLQKPATLTGCILLADRRRPVVDVDEVDGQLLAEAAQVGAPSRLACNIHRPPQLGEDVVVEIRRLVEPGRSRGPVVAGRRHVGQAPYAGDIEMPAPFERVHDRLSIDRTSGQTTDCVNRCVALRCVTA